MGRKKKDKNPQKQFFAESEEKIEDSKSADEAKKSSESKFTPEQIEREYSDMLNYQRKQRDNLLGNFSTGSYAIPDEIKTELLKIPKKFGVIEENVARLSTILGRFVLNFKIVFTIDPDICNAKLYIIEIEHGLDEDIKHETLLDEEEQPHNFEFRKFVFEKWHVYYDDDVLVKDTLLQNYLQMQQEENLFLGELEMILSQLFVVRMLAYLDKMGELGDKIRVDFKLAMEKYLAEKPELAQNFAFQKRILDKFIAKHNALLEIAKTDEGTKILLGYSTPLKNVRDKTYPATIIEPKKAKEEKKVEKTISKPTIKKKTSSPPKQKSYSFEISKVSKLGLVGGGGRSAQASRGQRQRTQTPAPPPPPRLAPVPPEARNSNEEEFSIWKLKSEGREGVQLSQTARLGKVVGVGLENKSPVTELGAETSQAQDVLNLGAQEKVPQQQESSRENIPEQKREAENNKGREQILL